MYLRIIIDMEIHKLTINIIVNNEYINRAKLLNVKLTPCKCCGQPISWSNSVIKSSRNGKISFTGRTQNTTKKVNDNIYHLQVCEDCFLRRYNKPPKFNVMSEPTKWAFGVSDEDFINSRRKYAMTKEHMIAKYGEDVGSKKWDNYVKKQSITNTFEYKKDKYGWTREEFDEYNKSRAVTLDNLISRYGEKKGTELWEDYKHKQHVTKSWDYMVKKYGEDEARKINSSKAITIDNMIRLYGEEEGIKKYRQWLSQFSSRDRKRFSYTSQKIFAIFKPIVERYGYTCKYASYLGEQEFITSTGGYFVDFYIPEIKVAIEYNGGVFHADPRLYKDDDHCDPFRPGLNAKQIREHDKIRIDSLAKEYNVTTYIIWEMDYQNGLDIEQFITSILNKYKHGNNI